MRIKQSTSQEAKTDLPRKRNDHLLDLKDSVMVPNSLMPIIGKGDKKKITLTKSSQRQILKSASFVAAGQKNKEIVQGLPIFVSANNKPDSRSFSTYINA